MTYNLSMQCADSINMSAGACSFFINLVYFPQYDPQFSSPNTPQKPSMSEKCTQNFDWKTFRKKTTWDTEAQKGR